MHLMQRAYVKPIVSIKSVRCLCDLRWTEKRVNTVVDGEWLGMRAPQTKETASRCDVWFETNVWRRFMSIREVSEALGVSASEFDFLSVLTDAQLTKLACAIKTAVGGGTESAALRIAALLTGDDTAGWAEGLSQLHAAEDPALWQEITGDCGVTDRGAFTSERYQVTYGLFQAWCENPFSPPQDVRFDLSSTNSEMFEHLPREAHLAALAPLAHVGSLRLSIWCRDIDDITALSALPNLMGLNLIGCQKITDFSILGQLSKLQRLDLGNVVGMADVQFLGKLTSLTLLKLYNAPALTSLSVLNAHPDLQVLSLSSCDALTDLDGLEACTQLHKVSINECKALAGLSGLAHCTGLKTLRIDRCENITALSSLSPCVALESFHASSLKLQSLDGLQNKPSLRRVHLDYSCRTLTDINGLEGCTGLEKLYMDGLSQSPMTNLSALSGCSALVDLYISGATKLEDISGLAGCVSLVDLTLREARIENVDALANCDALQSVALNRASRLKSIAGLAGKTKLETLRLEGCTALSNIDGLEALPMLTNLDLRTWGGRSTIGALPVPPDGNRFTDRESVQAYQNKIALVLAIQNGNREVVEQYRDITTLNLASCRMLTNPGLLQLLTNLTLLDLRYCDGLHFKVWRKKYDNPEKIAGFYARLAKKHPLEG